MKHYAFVGPDGSGKTSLIFKIISKIQTKNTSVRVIHFSPSLRALFFKNNRQIVTNPHALPPRSQVTSILKIFFILAKYYAFYFYISSIDIVFAKTTIVFWDRHLVDIIADPLRYRVNLSNVIKKLILLYPKPVKIFVVNAPPHVTLSRKCETDYPTALEIYNSYCSLSSTFSSVTCIDAEQSLDSNSNKFFKNIN